VCSVHGLQKRKEEIDHERHRPKGSRSGEAD
jgi:hypothetical protein